MVVPHGDPSLSQSADGCRRTLVNWDSINGEPRTLPSPLQFSLNMDGLDTSLASRAFADSLLSRLDHLGVIAWFYEQFLLSTGPHRNRVIIKLTLRLAK